MIALLKVIYRVHEAILLSCTTIISYFSRFCTLSSIEKLHNKLGKITAESILPLEYGGTVPLQDMTASWAQHLEQNR